MTNSSFNQKGSEKAMFESLNTATKVLYLSSRLRNPPDVRRDEHGYLESMPPEAETEAKG